MSRGAVEPTIAQRLPTCPRRDTEMWVVMTCGLIMTGFGLHHTVAARRHGRRPDVGLALGLAVGPFLCLLACNELINAATGQRPLALTVATGVAAIAGGTYMLYRTIRG